jgi:glycosyltransferase involved in cell wall biosynthesis
VELLEADGRTDEARQRTIGLCDAHPDEPAILQRGTATLTRLADREAALALADRVLGGRAPDGELVAALAAGLDAEGAADDAERLLRTHLVAGTLQATVGRASLLWWQGRPREAWDLVRALPPADVGASLLVKLGRSLRAKGELEAAKDAYAAAASVDPEQGRAGYWAEVVEGEWVRTSGRWHATPSSIVPFEGVPGRVLHIVTRSRPWAQVGYSIRTQYVAKGQQAVGLEPHVATQYGFPLTIGVEDAPASHLVESVPHHHFLPPDGQVPSRPDDRLTAGLESLAALLPELRPAVLHAASDYQNALLALRLGELFDVPVVYEVRGFWEESWLARSDRDVGSDAYRWRQERETECMERADAIVTLSEGMADEIVARGIDRSRITLVPNGVDVDAFVPVARDPGLARRWGIGPDDVTLGYVSTLWAYEGIDVLLRAAAKLVGRGLPVRVVIVGEGEAFADLQQLAADLGIRDRVAFTGRVPHAEVLSSYGLIDVFVVPRRDDRVAHLVTPLKPLEAMATSRALIVSGVAALRGMVEEGVTAEVFRPEDADDLARVAEGLVRDPERRTALGVAARAWVVEHRTWDRLAQGYADLYGSLTSTR